MKFHRLVQQSLLGGLLLALSACALGDCVACGDRGEPGNPNPVANPATYVFGLCVSNHPDADAAQEGCDEVVVSYQVERP